MQRYRIEYSEIGDTGGQRTCLPVPDIATALVVADINLANGIAELREGETLVARLEKRGQQCATFWHVG